MDPNILWLFAVLGGFIILGLAMAVGFMRSRKQDAVEDPRTPADDPSKGLDGRSRR